MVDENPGIEIEKCAGLAKGVVDLFESGASNEALEAPTMDALRFLWDQADALTDLVQGRPKELGRSGRDYADGVKLGALAHEIARKLGERGLRAPQEIALRIHVKALLWVQGHYHHIIGPAMLEHCDLLVELGRTEEASGSYDCVISDFSWLLDQYDGSDEALDAEDRISLESLREALSRRLEIGGFPEDAAAQLQKSRARAERILSSAASQAP